ncbi:hypothetical protein JMF89_06605 [Clostridiaceae bacterium UIB06]|uniref:SH3 domain-containing protein n=1 Tax=Clostridium thailandense TaxID=2794346 RepID=A0A949TGM8_9CLOT|nr:hypothetical protein [Clostridium thailandense]MBV7271860.1 hypothetical protein [Clostridium thailandense]MCH5136873.1 hypothetical protein [Clostridiaceae bacterium UIB06]
MNKKYLSVLRSSMISALLVISPTLVFAKTDAIVSKDIQGNYYQYDFKSLRKDAANNAVGLPSVLLDDFVQKKNVIVSYHDDKTGYVDSKFVNDAAIESCSDGGPCGGLFTLDRCTEIANEYENAILSFTKPIQTRILDSNGSVINGQLINPISK